MSRQEKLQGQVVTQIDYSALALAMVGAMQQAGVTGHVSIVEEKTTLPSSVTETSDTTKAECANITMQINSQVVGQRLRQSDISKDEPTEARIEDAYKAISAERIAHGDDKPISARDLALRAKVRRSTCSDWLKQCAIEQGGANGYSGGEMTKMCSDSEEMEEQI